MKITIWIKLLVGIILIIALVIFLSVYGINSVEKLGKLTSEVYNESVATNSIQNLKSDLERLVMPPNDFLIHGNQIEKQNYNQILDTIRSKLQRIEGVTDLYVTDIDLSQIKSLLSEIEIRAQKIFNLSSPIGNSYGAILMEEMDMIIVETSALIDRKILSSKEHLRKDILEAHNTYVKFTRFIIYIGLVIALSLLIGGFFYVREITRPIRHLKHTAQQISSGKSFAKADVKTHDEIEDLAKSFNQMIQTLERTTVSKKYFNEILNRMEDSLIITDVSDKIRVVNQATLDLLGYKEEEIIGISINDIIPRKESGDVSVNCHAVEENHKVDHVNNIYHNYISKGNDQIPISFSRSVMYDNANNINGMILIAHHVNDQEDEGHSADLKEEGDYRKIKSYGEVPLTKREIEIMKLIAEENSNQEIADKLFISVRTVETHRRNIMQKIHVNSVISLVHYAIQNRII